MFSDPSFKGSVSAWHCQDTFSKNISVQSRFHQCTDQAGSTTQNQNDIQNAIWGRTNRCRIHLQRHDKRERPIEHMLPRRTKENHDQRTCRLVCEVNQRNKDLFWVSGVPIKVLIKLKCPQNGNWRVLSRLFLLKIPLKGP